MELEADGKEIARVVFLLPSDMIGTISELPFPLNCQPIFLTSFPERAHLQADLLFIVTPYRLDIMPDIAYIQRLLQMHQPDRKAFIILIVEDNQSIEEETIAVVDDIWSWPVDPARFLLKVGLMLRTVEKQRVEQRQYAVLLNQKQLYLRQNAKLENTVTSIPFGILVADLEGRIVFMNKRAKIIIGLNLQDDVQTSGFLRDKIGYYPFDLVRGLDDRDGIVLEEMLELPSGTFSTKIVHIRDVDNNIVGTLILFQDAREILRYRSQAVELINSVLHEIRTPITSIITSLDLLNKHVSDSLVPRMKRVLELAQINSQRLVQLTTDFLDISRIESGFLDMCYETISISSLVDETLDSFYSSANEKNVELVSHLNHNDDMIEIDPSRLRQVFNNLISNAIKFSDNGSKIVLSTNNQGEDMVVISFLNYGKSIPPQDQTRIFERFFRSEHSVHRDRIGSGLGLHITKTIVDAFGGTLSVKSGPDIGTTFYLTIPRKKVRSPQCNGKNDGQ